MKKSENRLCRRFRILRIFWDQKFKFPPIFPLSKIEENLSFWSQKMRNILKCVCMSFSRNASQSVFPSWKYCIVARSSSRFHPNLIVGGTYSGQIVMWDNRTPKRTPVQRSPLTSLAHTVCKY